MASRWRSNMTGSIYSGMWRGSALAAWKEGSLHHPVWHRRIAVVLGVLTMLCAILGLAYNALMLTSMSAGGSDELSRQFKLTHFDAAFYTMSGCCIAFYVALLWGGYRLSRHSRPASTLLIFVWILEIAYFLGLQLLVLLSDGDLSIAAAFGVANGGLMVQYVILLPIWGPLVVWGLRRDAAPPKLRNVVLS